MDGARGGDHLEARETCLDEICQLAHGLVTGCGNSDIVPCDGLDHLHRGDCRLITDLYRIRVVGTDSSNEVMGQLRWLAAIGDHNDW